MFAAFVTGLAFAATAFALPSVKEAHALEKRSGPCDSIPVDSPLVVGSTATGGAYCETRWPSGDVVVHLKVWATDTQITAIQGTYATGDKFNIGDRSWGEVVSTMDPLKPGEKFTRAWAAGDGRASALGNLYIETSGGQKVTFGKSQAAQHEYDVGTGFLVGLTGSSGRDVDSLCMQFLGGKTKNLEVSNFKFDPDPSTAAGTTYPATLQKIHWYNALPTNMTDKFSGGTKQTSKYLAASTVTGTFGQAMTVKGVFSLPIVQISVKNEISWSVARATTTSWEIDNEVDQMYEQDVILRPGEGADCQAYAWTGQQDFQYTADVVLTMEGGAQFKFNEPGTLKSVVYSNVDAWCTPSNSTRSPTGFTPGTLSPVT